MSGRSREMLSDFIRQLDAEERRHQLNRGKPGEREQPHADVRFAARDVPCRICRGELRVQIGEKVERNLMCRDPFERVEVLMHVDEFFRFDIQAALLIEFAAYAGREALPEFKVAPGSA